MYIGIPYMGVSEKYGTPKSSILIGVSIINHPFCGTPIFGNIHMDPKGITSIFTCDSMPSTPGVRESISKERKAVKETSHTAASEASKWCSKP